MRIGLGLIVTGVSQSQADRVGALDNQGVRVLEGREIKTPALGFVETTFERAAVSVTLFMDKTSTLFGYCADDVGETKQDPEVARVLAWRRIISIITIGLRSRSQAEDIGKTRYSEAGLNDRLYWFIYGPTRYAGISSFNTRHCSRGYWESPSHDGPKASEVG